MIANVKILKPDRERFYCSSGSKERELFVLDGECLVSAGVENTQAIIDSFADSCDLNLILERVALGEYDLLTKSRGLFIDTTQFPTLACDIKNNIRQNQLLFESLPDDIKSELKSYDNFSKMSDEKFAQFIEAHKVYDMPVVSPDDKTGPSLGGEN